MLNLKSVWAVVATSIVAVSCYFSSAPPVVAVASLVGILYVVLVAYGHWTANVFGALLGGLFGYLSYSAGFFGNAAINWLFVIPMSLWGIKYWKDNQDAPPQKMTKYQQFRATLLFGGIVTLSMVGSYLSNASLWYLDGFTAVMPIFATVLLVCRYREQWLLWIPYNFLEVLMWFWVASTAPEMLAILAMRIVFFFNSLIGATIWWKE